jgi:GDP-L-fucose synthase
MKILITGGNGYVGKSLHCALKDKYDVTTITRNECDLNNSESVKLFFKDKIFDVVIHCAVKGGSRLQKDNWDVLDTNLLMYYNLLANKDHFNKFIHFGSGAELYVGNEPYGYSKGVIRKSVLAKDNFYNLRIFGTFDENELDTRFIKTNIKRYINKESMNIHQNRLMDFIYMPDLVKIVEYYINNDGPKEIDCIYNESLTLEKITRIINKLEEYKVDVEIINEGVDKPYIGTFNNLGIEFIGLEQGIKETYNKLKK